jgi:hypothetical protein
LAGLRSGWEGGRTGRIQIFPDSARELAGVAGANRLELRGDAVARPDLDLALAHASLELIERPNRRPADPFALEVVDTAVAGADEVAGGLDEAHRATEVGAAIRDGDKLARFLIQLLGAAADVGGGLAGVADALGFGEDDLAVSVLDEIAGRADRLPALLAAVEDRRHGKADSGQHDRCPGEAADALHRNGKGLPASHRLALEVARRLGRWALRPTACLGPVLLVRFVAQQLNLRSLESIDSGGLAVAMVAAADREGSRAP